MALRHWPLFGLRLRTPRLELRVPRLEELDALAQLAGEGVHDPGTMPFSDPWTAGSPEQRARNLLQHHWRLWSGWSEADWTLALAVFLDGVPVGVQEVAAREFAVVGEVRTSSWLGRNHQGMGIGTEMRAAVLHLAFAGLGASEATSAVVVADLEDSPASLLVSRKLGYRDDGLLRRTALGRPALVRRLRLDHAAWRAHARTPVEVVGLEPCLPLLGAVRLPERAPLTAV